MTKLIEKDDKTVDEIVEEFKGEFTPTAMPDKPTTELRTGTTIPQYVYDWLTQTLQTERQYWQQHEQDMYEALDAEYQLQLKAERQKREVVVERMRKDLTQTLDIANMLEGWERYWKEVDDGRYVQWCVECENSDKILQALTQPNNPK